MTATFTQTWDTSYEGVPADNENISLGAARIRDLKAEIRQRMAVDHSWSGDGNDGKHQIIQMRVSSGSGIALDATDGALYTAVQNTTDNNTELYYLDSHANPVQLTRNGAVAVPSPFASGTQIVFFQATAPTGWIQNTIANDKMLRMVGDSTGGSFGGSGWSITGLVASTTVLGHQLNSNELPSHSHQVNAITGTGGNVSFGNASPFVSLAQQSITSDGGAVGNAAHSHDASTSVFGDGSWRPSYANVLIGIKT